MNLSVLVAAILFTAAPAGQKNQPQATEPSGGMDMSKVGPASRKPKDEKAVKKEIDTFLKAQEEAMKKKDQATMLAAIDFPVFMATDNSQGVVTSGTFTQEQYVAMMKPMMGNEPKDLKVTHKYTVIVLSDSIADVVDDATVTTGKKKYPAKSDTLLIKRDGKWMVKSMVEAGWGDTMQAPPATK
jgi:hypothetical protein